jgi:hypothetical protein
MLLDPSVSNGLPALVTSLPTARVVNRVCEPIWVGIVDLKSGMCRFVRDGDGGVEFCGAATQSLSSSWCPAHKLICCATDPRRRA